MFSSSNLSDRNAVPPSPLPQKAIRVTKGDNEADYMMELTAFIELFHQLFHQWDLMASSISHCYCHNLKS